MSVFKFNLMATVLSNRFEIFWNSLIMAKKKIVKYIVHLQTKWKFFHLHYLSRREGIFIIFIHSNASIWQTFCHHLLFFTILVLIESQYYQNVHSKSCIFLIQVHMYSILKRPKNLKMYTIFFLSLLITFK